MHHHRLVVMVMVINLVILILGLRVEGWFAPGRINLEALSLAVLGNFTAAVLIRQHYVINVLFRLATSLPTHFPLSIRRIAGKVYHFGGIHVGAALSATAWYAGFVYALFTSAVDGNKDYHVSAVVSVLGVAVLVVMVLMVVTALPSLRSARHDRFEKMHRWGGWTALALVVTQSVAFTAEQGGSFWTTPNAVLLLVVVVSIALPWTRLRRVRVQIVHPSAHVALARFDYGVTPFAGSSTTVSRSPLSQWHSFANVPAPGQTGFRLTVSRAGDWTGNLIDNPPTHLWVKGIPTAGVGNIDKLFTRVIWVATGSGIGPCLPHLLAGDTPSRLVWSTRTPELTYGPELVAEIQAAQPNAMIWDTVTQGKPNLLELAYQAYRDFEAEAVICISNKATTWNIVEELESRGIPAYGAIWDS